MPPASAWRSDAMDLGRIQHPAQSR
jgi:hypothetical protein